MADQPASGRSNELPDPAAAAEGHGHRRRRRRRKHRYLRLFLYMLIGLAGVGIIVASGWSMIIRWDNAWRVLAADNIPGAAVGRILHPGDILAVPPGGRLVCGGPGLDVALLEGTRATVAIPANGLDLVLDGDGTLAADAGLITGERLHITVGAYACEVGSGRLRLRRRGDTIAVGALTGPVQLSRQDGGSTPIDPGTWVEIGANGRIRPPRPDAARDDLLAWWPGDEGGGNVLHDRSGVGVPWPLMLAPDAGWSANGILARAGAPLAANPVPEPVAAAIMVGSCACELWFSHPTAASEDLTVAMLTDGTGATLRLRLPPLPLGPGLHHLVVTFGHDRHQQTWVDGRLHADVPAPLLPTDLRTPLTFILTGKVPIRACAFFSRTLAGTEIAELFHAGVEAP